jgi:hypothetical protein
MAKDLACRQKKSHQTLLLATLILHRQTPGMDAPLSQHNLAEGMAPEKTLFDPVYMFGLWNIFNTPYFAPCRAVQPYESVTETTFAFMLMPGNMTEKIINVPSLLLSG